MGEEPLLVGQRCTGFVLQHFYQGQQITDQVNVAYLRFGEQWYRLYFECATIFWRASEPPEVAENADLTHGLLLNDLSGMESVVGQTVQAVAYEGSESGDVRATLTFANGKRLEFEHSCEADSTRLIG
ncbi:hypothetical protein [uncultured Meiothermus sp.]|jgi:hypothetical protein|uniref:hypothetical protein n=1 Tax=uncultured Meiothermus sp. TaxID=157471 RepID=UPI00261BEC54|nr:hypothetical protein [uncultured Meiothermus sp.]